MPNNTEHNQCAILSELASRGHLLLPTEIAV